MMTKNNFFDELVLCMKEQGFLELIDVAPKGHQYITLHEVLEIRKIENEIEGDLL
jgi:hypothetical protein